MEIGTTPAPAPAPAAAPPPAAPARPANFAEAFSKALTKHSGSPAQSQGNPQEPSAPSAPTAPAQEGEAPTRQRAPSPPPIPPAAYHAERSKRQELQAQLAVQAKRFAEMEAELAKLRQMPAQSAQPQASAEDAWLAQLADDDPAAKLAKSFEEYKKQNEERWQQVQAREQVMQEEQQNQALDGLLETLHARLPHMEADAVDQFATALLLAEPADSKRSIDEVLLPLWKMHQKFTPPSAPRAPSAPGAPAPKPPPQIGAPTTPAPPQQSKLKMGDFAKFVTDRLRQQQ